jgi:two-component system, chemotaxis family, CheB/CheR fusion protein
MRRVHIDMVEQNFEDLYIIGAGASAGGLEALTAFLSKFPAKSLPVSIFVVQHLSPTYKSMLAELLSKHSSLPVTEAVNNMKIEPSKVYITPPDCNITLHQGRIILSKLHLYSGPKPSVDLF